MKKRILLFLIIVLSVLSVICVCFIIFVFLANPTKRVSSLFCDDYPEIKSDYAFTNLVRCKDCLYYNYKGNVFNSGTYLISDNKTERITKAEITFLPEFSIDLFPLYSKADKPYYRDEYSIWAVPASDGYDQINKNKNACTVFAENNKEEITDYAVPIKCFDDKFYVLTSSKKDSNESFLYEDTGKGFKKVFNFEEAVGSYCIRDGYLYWISDKHFINTLCKTNLQTKKTEQIIELNVKSDTLYCNIFDVYMNNEWLYFTWSDEAIYPGGDKNTSQLNITALNTSNGNYINLGSGNNPIIKLCGEKVFYGFSETSGIFRFDEKRESNEKICGERITDFWILDKEFVYFSIENGDLYRINLEKKETEKVFG